MASAESIAFAKWIAEKAISISPSWIRKAELAKIDVDRTRLLALAEAQRDANEIAAGRLELIDVQHKYPMITAFVPKGDAKTRIEPTLGPLMEIAGRKVLTDAIAKEVNIAKAVTHAEEEIASGHNAGEDVRQNGGEVDDDWLLRWREAAGIVSAEELQRIWGRLLVGEYRSPGSVSLRTLDFVRNLSTAEAKEIERLGPFMFDGGTIINVESFSVEYGYLLDMQDLGVLSSANGQTITYRGRKDFPTFVNAIVCNEVMIAFFQADPNKSITLKAYGLTRIGEEVIRLGTFVSNSAYIKDVAALIERNGFSVEIRPSK